MSAALEQVDKAATLMLDGGSALRTLVLTDKGKIGRRARHHTLALDEIDLILMDAQKYEVAGFTAAGARFIHA